MKTYRFVIYIAKPETAMTYEEIIKLYKKFAANTKQKKSRILDNAAMQTFEHSIHLHAAKIEHNEVFINRMYPGVVFVSKVIKGDWEIDPGLIPGAD